MRLVIWLLLLCAAAVVAALVLGDNRGLVSLYWSGWRYDLSLNLALLLLVAGAAAITALVQTMGAAFGLPERARAWQALKAERQAQAALREAMAESLAGRYSRAVRAAERVLALRGDLRDVPDLPLVQVLAHAIGAGAAHRLQDRARRDEWLAQGLAVPDAGAATELLRLRAAAWAVDDRDGAAALAQLAELAPGTARRTVALRLKLQAARLAGQPVEALRTARLLANHQAFTPVAATALRRTLALDALGATRDVAQLREVWQAFDAVDRRDAVVVAEAARHAAVLDEPLQALAWLQPAWDELASRSGDERQALALALADVVRGRGADVVDTAWLARAEKAQRAFGADAAVQAAVGALLVERGLWGMARRPLEQAATAPTLGADTRRHAWRALARLAQQEGDAERASACHRAAALIE